MEERIDGLEDKLGFLRRSLDTGHYDVVVKECSTLFELSLRKLFRQALTDLPYRDRLDLQDAEKTIGKNTKGVGDFGFGELVGLFRQSNLLKKWSQASGRQLGLLSSLDFSAIVDLRNRVTHDGAQCSRLEADLVFNYLMNLLAILGVADLDASVKVAFKQLERSGTSNNEDSRIFLYQKSRGVLINDADNSRNIAFKVETINNIFHAIHREIEKISDSQMATNIFRISGCEAGSSFGSLMSQKWDLENEFMSLGDKVKRWCEFDSDVGWGKFENQLQIVDEEESFSGKVLLIESFQVYKKGKSEPAECLFMVGYTQGVLEQIFGGNKLDVTCDMSVCPLKNPLKKICVFCVEKSA